MNRIQAASGGFSKTVSTSPTEWVILGLVVVAAIFVIGYLVQRSKKK